MKAAIYARYSTELQSADSIGDQFRVCERLAARHGFTVGKRFSDAAITGGTAERTTNHHSSSQNPPVRDSSTQRIISKGVCGIMARTAGG